MSEDAVMTCPIHPDNEASLRCIRCDRPMCMNCIVGTSVGYICKQCARKSDDRFFQGTMTDDVIGFAVCAVASLIANAATLLLGGWWMFAIVIGGAAGSAIGFWARRAMGGRLTRNSAYIAIAATVVGCLAVGLFTRSFLNLGLWLCTFAMASSLYGIFMRRI